MLSPVCVILTGVFHYFTVTIAVFILGCVRHQPSNKVKLSQTSEAADEMLHMW